MPHDRFHLRKAEPHDIDEVVDVCAAALGWTDPNFDRALFRWKHVHNPFGHSQIFIAEDDDGIAAVRPFMHWNFIDGTGGTTTDANPLLRATRAVDTATHPRAQGQGLFRSLTEMGLAELEKDGTSFVFNTPNEKSLRGYLTMGWLDAGQIEFGYGIRSPLSLPRLVGARTAASKKSLPTPEIGLDIEDGLALLDAEKLDQAHKSGHLTTAHTIETLRWRYGQSPMTYRFLAGPDGSGLIVRLRQRGSAIELVVAQKIGQIENDVAGRAIRNAMARSSADHCIGWKGLGATVSTDRLGPTLALRALSESPNPAGFEWQPGDIELF